MHCRMLSTLPSGCDNQRCLQTLPNIPWCAKPPRSRTSGLGVELSADVVVPGAQVGSASRRPTSRPQTRPLPPGPPPQPNGPYCLNRFSTATKPVCFGGRKTSLGSLRPLPSLCPVPGGQEALPAARGHSAPPPLPPPDSLLASCMRVPLTVSEGQASAPLLSASRQLREELATRYRRRRKLGPGAEPHLLEVTRHDGGRAGTQPRPPDSRSVFLPCVTVLSVL